MRFLSSRPDMVYVIKRKRHQIIEGIPELIHGLRAEFRRHVFDSEVAQKRLDWSDAEREQVERYLMNHEDFGKRARVAGNLGVALYLEGQFEQEIAQAQSHLTQLCIFVVVTDAGPEQCGKLALEGEVYCSEHIHSSSKAKSKPKAPAAA